MKGILRIASLGFCFAFAMTLFSCSSGGDDSSALLALVAASNGGTTQTTSDGTNATTTTTESTPTPASNPEQTPAPTPTPAPPATYTITFNANDGSQSPATATQTFTAGTPQALKTIASLGFSKSGYNFAGWGTAANAAKSAYADGASYTASAAATLYAMWSTIPVYSVNIPVNQYGSVTASPATGIAGTEVTLSNTPKIGWRFDSYTVTAADSSSVTVTDGKFTMPEKDVTVTATFVEIPAASGAYKKIDTITINEKQYDLVSFGLWPQTIKAAAVNIDKNQTKTAGAFTYCRGSDGQWYANIKENAYGSDYKYTDGTAVAQGGTSEKWFKVEPIKWRVLTTSYNGTGKKLLLAESILTNCAYYDYVDGNHTVTRTVGGTTIYSNNYEHSRVRAFLNGLSYQKKEKSAVAQTACNDFLGKGFFQTAFATDEQAKIAGTSVNNSARSTNPDGDANAELWHNGNNQYASNTSTTDKIFFLSEQEVTKTEYDFDVYDASSAGNTRLRQTTDYAKANGAYYSTESGMGWWLRSPYYVQGYVVLTVSYDGRSDALMPANVDYGGIVPALCVEN